MDIDVSFFLDDAIFLLTLDGGGCIFLEDHCQSSLAAPSVVSSQSLILFFDHLAEALTEIVGPSNLLPSPVGL